MEGNELVRQLYMLTLISGGFESSGRQPQEILRYDHLTTIDGFSGG